MVSRVLTRGRWRTKPAFCFFCNYLKKHQGAPHSFGRYPLNQSPAMVGLSELVSDTQVQIPMPRANYLLTIILEGEFDHILNKFKFRFHIRFEQIVLTLLIFTITEAGFTTERYQIRLSIARTMIP